MARKTKIVRWESWNAIEEDLVNNILAEERDYLRLIGDGSAGFEEDEMGMELRSFPLSTPFGDYDPQSVFKPSSRWDCWLGYTNFPITERVVKILNEDVAGIEALSVLGAYTFCVGIAKLFTWQDVRKEIEKKICK